MKVNKKIVSFVLAGLGCAGMCLTSWLSIKCSKKADTKNTKKEKIKSYIPAIISGAGTVACTIASPCVMNSHYGKEIAMLTAGLSYMATNRDLLNDKLQEAVGKDYAKEDNNDIQAKIYNDTKDLANGAERTGYGDVLFLDEYSGRKFFSSCEKVEEALERLNNDVKSGVAFNGICYNDLFRYYNITESDWGAEFGWPPSFFDGYLVNLKAELASWDTGKPKDYYIDADPIPYQMWRLDNNMDKGYEYWGISIETYPTESWYNYS